MRNVDSCGEATKLAILNKNSLVRTLLDRILDFL